MRTLPLFFLGAVVLGLTACSAASPPSAAPPSSTSGDWSSSAPATSGAAADSAASDEVAKIARGLLPDAPMSRGQRFTGSEMDFPITVPAGNHQVAVSCSGASGMLVSFVVAGKTLKGPQRGPCGGGVTMQIPAAPKARGMVLHLKPLDATANVFVGLATP